MREHEGVSDATKVYVETRLRETRHDLRNDVTAPAARVEAAAVLATREHGEVSAKLDQLSRDVAELKPLARQVAALETADAIDQAEATTTEKLLARQRTQFFALATLIVGAAGVIVAFAQ